MQDQNDLVFHGTENQLWYRSLVMQRSLAKALQEYLADRIRERKREGMTQKEIAKEVDLSDASISTLLSGKKGGLRVDTAERIAAYFGLDLLTALRLAAEQELSRERGTAADVFSRRPEAIRVLRGEVRQDVLDAIQSVRPGEVPGDPSLIRWLQLAANWDQMPPRPALPAHDVTEDAKRAIEAAKAEEPTDDKGLKHSEARPAAERPFSASAPRKRRPA